MPTCTGSSSDIAKGFGGSRLNCPRYPNLETGYRYSWNLYFVSLLLSWRQWSNSMVRLIKSSMSCGSSHHHLQYLPQPHQPLFNHLKNWQPHLSEPFLPSWTPATIQKWMDNSKMDCFPWRSKNIVLAASSWWSWWSNIWIKSFKNTEKDRFSMGQEQIYAWVQLNGKGTDNVSNTDRAGWNVTGAWLNARLEVRFSKV